MPCHFWQTFSIGVRRFIGFVKYTRECHGLLIHRGLCLTRLCIYSQNSDCSLPSSVYSFWGFRYIVCMLPTHQRLTGGCNPSMICNINVAASLLESYIYYHFVADLVSINCSWHTCTIFFLPMTACLLISYI